MEVVKQERPLSVRKRTRAELTCEDAVRTMGDFLSDALSPERYSHFEQHLKACRECGRFLRTYKKTIEAMRNVLSSHPSTPVLRLRKPARELYDVEFTDELLN